MDLSTVEGRIRFNIAEAYDTLMGYKMPSDYRIELRDGKQWHVVNLDTGEVLRVERATGKGTIYGFRFTRV